MKGVEKKVQEFNQEVLSQQHRITVCSGCIYLQNIRKKEKKFIHKIQEVSLGSNYSPYNKVWSGNKYLCGPLGLNEFVSCVKLHQFCVTKQKKKKKSSSKT